MADDLTTKVENPQKLKAELLNLFLPAHDGLAVILTNIFFNLSRHPDIYSKLRQEVLGVPIAELSFERLKNMKYLQSVINKMLRFTPPVAINSRAALRDTHLPRGGGPDGRSQVFIRKGGAVFTPLFALHRQKEVFGEDVEQFRPER